jgi:hypothetical protein
MSSDGGARRVASSESDVVRPRLFEENYFHESFNVDFHGQKHTFLMVITAFGDCLVECIGYTQISTGKGKENAHKQFSRITQKIPELRHNYARIVDELQVFTYLFDLIMPMKHVLTANSAF